MPRKKKKLQLLIKIYFVFFDPRKFLFNRLKRRPAFHVPFTLKLSEVQKKEIKDVFIAL